MIATNNPYQGMIFSKSGAISSWLKINASYCTLQLQYFSVNPMYRHTIEECLYVPSFSPFIDYNELVAEVIALNCAAKICKIYGNSEQAETFLKEMHELVQSITA